MRALDVAREWVGTPYAHAGRLKGVGVDCVGLVLGVAKELGMIPADYSPPYYEAINDGVLIQAIFPLYATEKDLKAIEPGDLVVMKFGEHPQHVGIIADCPVGFRGLSIIHAYHPGGKVVEHSMNDKWLGRIVQAWQVQWAN